MAGDVYVSFGADTGALEAAFAVAKAETNSLAREMRSLAQEMQSTGAAADSELGQRLSSVANSFAEAKEHVSALKSELKGVGESGAGIEAVEGGLSAVKGALETMTAPIRAVTEGLGGIAAVVSEAFAVREIIEFVKSMGELGEATERTSAILGITTEEVGRLQYVFAMTGTPIERLNMMMGRFEENLEKAASTGTGRMAAGLQALGLSAQELVGLNPSEQIEKIADAVSSFPDSSSKTAALQSLGRGWVEMIPLLDQGSAKIRELNAAADATNTVLNATQTEGLAAMQHGFVDLGKAITGDAILAFGPFIDVVNASVKVMRDMVGAIGDSIKSGGEWAIILEGLANALKIVVTGVILLIETLRGISDMVAGPLNALLDWAQGVGTTLHDIYTGQWAKIAEDSKAANAKVAADLKSAYKDYVAAAKTAVEEMNAVWKESGSGIEGLVRAHRAAEEEFSKPLVPTMDESASANLQRQIDAVTDSIKKLKDEAAGIGAAISGGMATGGGATALTGATGDAAALIRHFEGFREHAYPDKPGYAVGYGSHQTTSPSGVVSETTADTVVTREDAERDLARRIVEFQNIAARDIGSAWAGLSDKAKASITSVTYNYGHLPAEVAAAARTGSEPAIASAIGGLSSNPERRRAEAANITSTAVNDKLIDQESELAKLKDKQFQQDQEKAGGSAAKKADLDIAEKEAKATQNALTMAKEKAAAAQADADAHRKALGDVAGFSAKQAELDKAAAEAKKKVLDVTNQQTEAEAKLNVAKAKQGEDAKAIYDAEVKAANVKMAAAGADPVKQAEATQALIAAQTAYSNAVEKEADARSKMEIEKAKETADAERASLTERLKLHEINDAQWLAGTTAALDKYRAVVQQAYDAEIAGAKDKSLKKEQLALDEQKKLGEIAKQEAADQAKAAENAQKAWDGVSKEIVGTFTTGLKAMITGHQTFQQAATKALEGLTNKAIDLIGQQVEKWLAGELAKTAASIQGEATRTAAASAGSAASVIPMITNATKAITIDAGQTFGGVFAFLAPFLGPAAAGPATAASTTVMAAAAFDIGAYDVPTTQLALVHQNELVMPAPQASAFRSMLEGSIGLGRSVNVNPAVHFNVAANDGQSVQQFFQNNHKAMLTAVDRAVRHGAALGLRSFTP